MDFLIAITTCQAHSSPVSPDCQLLPTPLSKQTGMSICFKWEENIQNTPKIEAFAVCVSNLPGIFMSC